MTLRRYTPLRAKTPMKASRGTVIPPKVRRHVHARDMGCVGPRVGMPGQCAGPIEQDHVRASGGIGMKSRSTADNVVDLCSFVHHRMKTDNGRTWRPILVAYLDEVEGPAT